MSLADTQTHTHAHAHTHMCTKDSQNIVMDIFPYTRITLSGALG